MYQDNSLIMAVSSKQISNNYKRNLIFLLLSAITSGIGTGMTMSALGWVIINIYHKSQQVAFIQSVSTLLSFIFMLNLMSIIDKFDRKKILQILFLIGFFLQLITYLYWQNSERDLLLLYICSVISVVIRLGDQVTRTALIREITPPDNQFFSSKALEFTRQFITFMSGAIGMLILNFYTFDMVLLIDAFTYLAALFLLIFVAVHSSNINKAETNKTSYLQEISSGVDFCKSNKFIFIFSIITLIPYILIIVQNILYPSHFAFYLNSNAGAYAFLSVPYGLGALLSVRMKQLEVDKMILRIKTNIFIYIIVSLAIGLIRNVYVTYMCLFVFAFAHSCIRVDRLSLQMKYVPNENIGKFTSLFEIIAILIITPLGLFISYIVDNYDLYSAWLIISAISLLCLVIFNKYTNKLHLNTWNLKAA